MSTTVDIGILTIRDDEFRAVLDAFPEKVGPGVYQSTRRQYILRRVEIAGGGHYTVAILRQVEQGTGDAQHTARDLMDDLAPRLLLVVGIAGGLPSDDVTLGDVVLGTRIHDYTVEAVTAGHEATFAATGGAIDQTIAAAVATLPGREDELGDWTSGLPARPPAVRTEGEQLYGPPDWQRELRARLESHRAGAAARRPPRYVSGPIASSDRLVKDPTVLFPWITTARNLLAVEMESGGVYRAARERCPMLPIRGISDIVGLRRDEAWTKFACASAAAFARAFLQTRPVAVDSTRVAPAARADESSGSRTLRRTLGRRWIAVLVVLLVAAGSAGLLWSLLPGMVSIRVNFYAEDSDALQPITGSLHVYTGAEEHPVVLDGTASAEIDRIKKKYLGARLNADLKSKDFEIDRATLPVLTTEGPLKVHVRRRRVNYGCADAKFEIVVVGVDAVDFAPDPEQKSLGITVRLISDTPHPVHLRSFILWILTTNLVPMYKLEFAQDNVDLPESAELKTILDVLIPKDRYALLEAGRDLRIGARCQNPFKASDAGDLVESDPWSMPARPEKPPVEVSKPGVDPVGSRLLKGQVFPIGKCRRALLEEPQKFGDRWNVKARCVCVNGTKTDSFEIASYADPSKLPSAGTIGKRLEEAGQGCAH